MNIHTTTITKIASVIAMLMAFLMLVSMFTGVISMAAAVEQSGRFVLINPYENVDWATYGQYKAANHMHSTYSDGSNFREDTLKDMYAKDFDIVAMTDHDVTTTTWDVTPDLAGNWNNIGTSNLDSDDLAAINAGTYDKTNPSPGQYDGDRTHDNGMISMGSSNEVTAENGIGDGAFNGHHLNAFFVSGLVSNIGLGKTMAQVLTAIQDIGGISHINHPGRYTLGQNDATQSSNPANVKRYVDLFMNYWSCVGIEIINKWDGESIHDRILWDNILMQTMPLGRSVWGFTNDDSHSLSGNGHAWNVMLIPELTEEATKTAMITGAFYGVSRIDRQYGINAYAPNSPAQTTTTATMYDGGADNFIALDLLAQSPPPNISNIVVNGNTITITGDNYHTIYWIADGEVVATGDSIDVSKCSGINSYVRAELVGTTGVAYTQPFGVTTVKSATPSANVTQLNGNKNDLTITIVEQLSNGQTNTIEKIFNINNNAADTYTVGSYKVYADTKGNTQIRDCRIVP
jgi:hypothetical protein